jgi:hypothetical protein
MASISSLNDGECCRRVDDGDGYKCKKHVVFRDYGDDGMSTALKSLEQQKPAEKSA